MVEIPAVRDEVAVGGFAQDRARLRERFLRARVCCSPLPSSKAVPASLRAAEQGKQGNRTRGHRKLPDSAESGLQGALPGVAASAANSLVSTASGLILQEGVRLAGPQHMSVGGLEPTSLLTIRNSQL